MEMIINFILMEIKHIFTTKAFAPSLVLKVSDFGTQKWPIGSEITRHLINQSELYGISAHDARLMHLVRVLIG